MTLPIVTSSIYPASHHCSMFFFWCGGLCLIIILPFGIVVDSKRFPWRVQKNVGISKLLGMHVSCPLLALDPTFHTECYMPLGASLLLVSDIWWPCWAFQVTPSTLLGRRVTLDSWFCPTLQASIAFWIRFPLSCLSVVSAFRCVVFASLPLGLSKTFGAL